MLYHIGTREDVLGALQTDPTTGLSTAEAEKRLAETEIRLFEARKYELSGSEPFLYYVLRRKTECANVRAAMVCLNAGMKESEIKKRLRGL